MAQKAASVTWHNVYDEFTHKHWRGYAGNWFMFAKGRPDPVNTLKALRTFKFHDEGRRGLTHRNIYTAPGILTPVQRDADGLWEQCWERSPEDPSYWTDMRLTDAERAGTTGAPVRRLVSLCQDAYVGAPPRLPSAEWAPQQQWAAELFLRGGDGTRWSFGAVYPAAPAGDGAAPFARTMHFLIQEQWAGEVPDSPIDMGAIPFFEPREGRPSEHPAEWLRGPVAGTRYETHVTAGGAGLSAMSESPVSAWAPPAPPAGHELLLLPDEMYAVVPSGVGSGTDACGAGGGVVFEFGGRMRDGRGLRRVRTEYAAGGAVKGFAYEALTCGA